MSNFPFLSTLIFLPALGALAILLFLRTETEETAKASRVIALVTSIITFLVSLVVLAKLDGTTSAFQFVEHTAWIKNAGIGYYLGIDGISLWFVLLTTLLMPFCILASWESIETKVRGYMALFLLLETLILGVFLSLDFVMFYFFFEAVLIPMFFIIGIWGGKDRVYAAFKFFLYTLLGSVLLLLAILYLYYQGNTMSIPELMNKAPLLPLSAQKWLWLAFFASFAVKVPMWPVHTWLPDAHVQAPTAGSMILAGILLKLGGYGFLRLSLPMLPNASIYYADFVYALSIIAVIYTSLVALVQQDMKKLIAYSSIAHMAYVTAGTFALNVQGIEGGIFQMLSHGVVSAALFMCVGVIYDRMHTREIVFYGGLVERMPYYALLFMVFMMASVGLPGTSGFVGEFLVLLGVFQDNAIVMALIGTGVVLGAAYMLWLYKRVVFGEMTNAKLKKIADVDAREIAILLPMAVLAILLGIYPSLILKPVHASVQHLLQQVQTSKTQIIYKPAE